MGGNSSKQDQFTADMNPFEVASVLDSEVESFVAAIDDSTHHVVASLAVEVNESAGSISFDAIREIINCLRKMHEQAAGFSLHCMEDIWNSKELRSFVEDYFKNSLKTLEFCTALESCLKLSRDKHHIMQQAVRNFAVEVKDGVDGAKYEKTLQELRNYKAAEDPFTKEFFAMFKSVYEEHVLMLEKLEVKMRKLDKKLNSLKTLRTVSNVIFVTAFVSVLVLSVVAAAIAAPPLVTALLSALAAPLGSAGAWSNSLWKPHEDEVKRQKKLIKSMKVGTQITITDLRTIEKVAKKLEIEIDTIGKSAAFGLREEGAVKVAVDEINKKLDAFMTTIQQLSDQADTCSQDIRRARTTVLQTMFNPENN